MIQEFLLDRVLVEPGDGGQPPGDGRAGPAPGLQLPGEALDVGAADGEQGQGPGPAPVGELAQVQRIGLAGQAAVSGQEPGEGDPFGIGEDGLDRGGSRTWSKYLLILPRPCRRADDRSRGRSPDGGLAPVVARPASHFAERALPAPTGQVDSTRAVLGDQSLAPPHTATTRLAAGRPTGSPLALLQPDPSHRDGAAGRYQRTWNWLARMPLNLGGLPIGLVMT